MGKRVISIVLAILMAISLLSTAAVAAVTSLGNVTFAVSKNKKAGLGGDVKITFTKFGGQYSGTLYLPGSADTSKLTLSWDESVTVSTGGVSCVSGETSVPANGKSKTYSVTVGGNTASFTVKTMQGSVGVEGMFLTIDENLGTIAAMLGDQNHEETCYGNLSLDGKSYDMSIKGRGNSSWTFDFDKKPFNITLYKDEDAAKEIAKYSDKKKAELIDGVEAKKWTILANAKDSSLLRNKIGYDIALAMGLGVDNRFIDVWMNGEYLGNYLLTPKTDTLAPKKGYQIELERRTDNEDPQFTLKGFEHGTRPIYFTVKDNEANAETADIKAYMQKVADAILNTKSSDYLNYIDLDSWAKMYLLNELYKDVDVVTDSIFMYRNGTNDGDKLYAGPIWDLDGAIGRTYSNSYCGVDNTNQTSPDKWYIDGIQYDNNRGYLSWLQMLGRHKDFMQRVYELYNEYSSEFDALETQITEQAAVIADSANMNFNIHPVNQTVERMFNVEKTKTVGSGTYKITYKVTNSWADYVDNLKKFVTARNAFFSDNLTVTAPVGSITGTTSVVAGDTLTLTADTTANAYQWQSSNDGINWTDIVGATNKTYSVAATLAMNGLSIRCVAKNVGNTINTTRVAKAAAAAVTVLSPVTLTIDWEKDIAYKVEVNDYVVGWDLVLVYTNDEVPGFTYDGEPMYDLSELGYEFGTVWNQNGTDIVTPGTGYTYVFGLVINGNAVASKVAPSEEAALTIDDNKAKNRYDVNNSNSVDINDLVAVAAVYNVNDEYLNEERMSIVLLADVSGNKMVDTYDCSLIKSNGDVEDFQETD